MQRPDGELMHEYDVEAQAPIDVQHLYYSGETAFALLRAHAVLGNPEDLRVATGAMTHLTGAAWDFFGSRYYYGEEHWTCIAAGRSGHCKASMWAMPSTSASAGQASTAPSSTAPAIPRGRRAADTGWVRCSCRA